MHKIAQCAPGVVELVLIPLRQCLEEQQRRRKQGTSSLQGELSSCPSFLWGKGCRCGEVEDKKTGLHQDYSYTCLVSGLSQKARGEGAPDPQGGEQLRVGRLPVPRPLGYSQALQGDRSFVLQIAEKEQELLASQETVQVLQMKVRRLEHLLQLKNVHIEDLSWRLQQAERKQRRMDCFPEPRSHMQRPGMHLKAVPDTRGGSALVLPVLGLGGWSPSSVRTPRTRSLPSSDDSSVSIQASPLCPGPKGKLPQTPEGLPCPSWALTWDPTGGWKVQQLKG
ncbi:sperm flagellar protein 1 isoform X3 [Phocoena sinus]|nr:sperm flagellar protein 1 isoform X3 [Phocoena sinus]